MEVQAAIFDSFLDGSRGGNPAGVVLNADNLSHIQKQKIAQKLGLSETAFLSGVDSGQPRIEFYTPLKQIPMCGHATVATMWALREQGKISDSSLELQGSDSTLKVHFIDKRPYLEVQAVNFHFVEDQAIPQSLGLADASAIISQPVVSSAGVPFICIEVKNLQTLKQIEPDLTAISSISERAGAIGFYLFALTDPEDGYHLRARMFAPFYGINEESATGMGATALVGYLKAQGKLTQPEILVAQGRDMQPASPCLLRVRVPEQGRLGLCVGGDAKMRELRSVDI